MKPRSIGVLSITPRSPHRLRSGKLLSSRRNNVTKLTVLKSSTPSSPRLLAELRAVSPAAAAEMDAMIRWLHDQWLPANDSPRKRPVLKMVLPQKGFSR